MDASMRLLSAMVEQRKKGLSEGDAEPEAARGASIEPDASEYHAAPEYLLTSGDVAPHPNETLAARGIYRVTSIGLARSRGG